MAHGTSPSLITGQTQLRAELVRVVFRQPTGYTVLAMQAVEPPGARFTAVGDVPAELHLEPHQAWRLTGAWVESRRYGRQFRLTGLAPDKPRSAAALEALLASGLISGIGPERAKRIIDRFGVDAWDLLNHASERLMDVPGIGPGLFRAMTAAWRQHQQQAALLAQLCEAGLSLALATKVLRHFGASAEGVLSTNPYRLTEVRGIGFRTADALAQRRGVPARDPARLLAGLREALTEAVQAGHVYLPEARWRRAACELLAVEPDAVALAARQLVDLGEVILDGGRIYAAALYAAERRVETRLKGLVQQAPRAWQGALDPRLTPTQRQAVRWAMTLPVSILTGLPGTGKSFTAGQVVRAARAAGERVALCAPTGKAAKRLTELADGQEAMTIHRLLEYTPDEGYGRHAEHTLEADVVIVDEASMMDLLLFDALLAALAPGTRLVLIGDQHQLPSVGPGQVLRDLIDSGWLPVTELREIHRQAAGSPIITLAHQVHEGLLPALRSDPPGTAAEVRLRLVTDAEEGVARVAEAVTQALRETPPEDIQLLTPMRKGPLGTHELNKLARRLFHPHHSQSPSLGGLIVGDRVVQRANNYQKAVYNGEVGLVHALDLDEGTVTIRMGDRLIAYAADELDELELAYAMTIHKAQGSEFQQVILVLHQQHYVLLRRELLYTGITRARRILTLIGSAEALRLAVRREERARRFSALCQGLPSGAPSAGQGAPTP